MPGAERPDVEELAAELLQHRPCPGDVGGIAADHDGERAVSRLDDRARHRRIDERDAVRRERVAQRAAARRVGRAHVDDERAALERRQRLEHHLAHRIAVGQHGDEHIRSLHRLAQRRMRAVAARVVGLDGKARGGKVRGHGHAHRAQADEGYSFDANTSFAQRNATTAAGTPQ